MLPALLLNTLVLATSVGGDARCPSPGDVLEALRRQPAHDEAATATPAGRA